jgi:hypothetical protein
MSVHEPGRILLAPDYHREMSEWRDSRWGPIAATINPGPADPERTMIPIFWTDGNAVCNDAVSIPIAQCKHGANYLVIRER